MPSHKTYLLWVKVNAQWEVRHRITAADHAQAFRRAMTLLTPDLYDKEIRLEVEATTEGGEVD